jgi:DNA-binding MarR family transcriptional regulator
MENLDEVLLREMMSIGRKIFQLRRLAGLTSNISAQEYVIMAAILDSKELPVNAGMISKSTGISISYLSKILNSLELKRLIKRNINLKNRRQILIELTKKGQVVLEKARKERVGWTKMIVGNLSLEQKEKIWQGLKIFNDAVDKTIVSLKDKHV